VFGPGRFDCPLTGPSEKGLTKRSSLVYIQERLLKPQQLLATLNGPIPTDMSVY